MTLHNSQLIFAFCNHCLTSKRIHYYKITLTKAAYQEKKADHGQMQSIGKELFLIDSCFIDLSIGRFSYSICRWSTKNLDTKFRTYESWRSPRGSHFDPCSSNLPSVIYNDYKRHWEAKRVEEEKQLGHKSFHFLVSLLGIIFRQPPTYNRSFASP